jgi:hypothetical protein
LERWIFDLRSFPSVSKRDRDVPFASSISTGAAPSSLDGGDQLKRKVNLADLEADFRATLSRISTSAAKLRSLPEGLGAPECSFTLTIEVKPTADRPVGRLEKEERKWIAAEPDPFSDTPSNPDSSSGSGKAQTHAIRRLEASELRMEVWVEESAAKFTFPVSSSASQMTPEERRTNMSYGAGTEKFDPGNLLPYDLEPADVNRKPQGGAMTDY